MAYKLIIFDFDGTLADSVLWFASVLNDVARAHRFRTIGATEMAMLRGQGNREIVRYMGVPAWKMPFIATHVRKLAAEAAPKLKLYKQVPDVLRDLKSRGVRLAVVSSNAEKTIRLVLGPELAGLVDHYACGAGVFGKAAKFRKVVRAAKVSPGETLCVGDEVRDIDAAREAGLAAGAVAWGYATREILAAQAPSHLFERPTDILLAAT
jgi:phosphoglycolate phosphatase